MKTWGGHCWRGGGGGADPPSGNSPFPTLPSLEGGGGHGGVAPHPLHTVRAPDRCPPPLPPILGGRTPAVLLVDPPTPPR